MGIMPLVRVEANARVGCPVLGRVGRDEEYENRAAQIPALLPIEHSIVSRSPVSDPSASNSRDTVPRRFLRDSRGNSPANLEGKLPVPYSNVVPTRLNLVLLGQERGRSSVIDELGFVRAENLAELLAFRRAHGIDERLLRLKPDFRDSIELLHHSP